METKAERTGFRDETLSKRHRLWGWNCPMMDVDFLAIEYNRLIPVAIIDYKCEKDMSSNEAGYTVLKKLGDMAGIPSFWVRYKEDLTEFSINPINDAAKNLKYRRPDGIEDQIFANNKAQKLTEIRYVGFLYWLRGATIPNDIADKILNRNQ